MALAIVSVFHDLAQRRDVNVNVSVSDRRSSSRRRSVIVAGVHPNDAIPVAVPDTLPHRAAIVVGVAVVVVRIVVGRARKAEAGHCAEHRPAIAVAPACPAAAPTRATSPSAAPTWTTDPSATPAWTAGPTASPSGATCRHTPARSTDTTARPTSAADADGSESTSADRSAKAGATEATATAKTGTTEAAAPAKTSATEAAAAASRLGMIVDEQTECERREADHHHPPHGNSSTIWIARVARARRGHINQRRPIQLP